MRIFTTMLSLALVGLFPNNSAYAQYDPVSVGNWQLSSNISQVGSIIVQQQNGQKSPPRASKNALPVTPRNVADTKTVYAALAFPLSNAVRKKSISDFLTRTRTGNRTEDTKLETFFASVDLFGETKNMLRPYGMTTENLVDAYALWMINMWSASRGKNDDVSKKTMFAVQQQASTAAS
jgi:hypothetical protein